MTWLRNIFLTIIAWLALIYVGKWILIASVIVCICKAMYHLEKEPLSSLFFELACGIDEVGNIVAGPLFNFICFKPGAIIIHKFGSRNHTLSMIFGVNWDNLNIISKAFCWLFVELWDRGHFARAAENYKKLICTSHG